MELKFGESQIEERDVSDNVHWIVDIVRQQLPHTILEHRRTDFCTL